MANNGAVGPVGVAADPNSPNDIYVTNYATGTLYRYDSTTGGIEGPAHQVSPLGLYGGNNATGLAFDKDGKLYVALQGSWAVAEISKANGSIIRYLDSTWGIFYCATGIATDPISGDLFVSSPCGWPILYVHPDGSGGGSVGPAVDGITFGPDGTLWGEGGGNVYKIDGSNKPTFGAFTAVGSVAGGDGISVAAASDNPALPPYVFVNDNDGNITKVDLSGALPSYSAVTSGGSRGDFSTVAYNGCLYATQPDRVIKVTNADGTCSLAPVTPDDATALALTAQATDDFNDTITVSATLTNVSKSLPLAGQSVGFTLGSATCTAATTAAGIATGAAACSVVANQPSGATTISAAYAGDAYYVPAAASVAANVIASARAIKQGALDMLNGLVSPSGKKSDDDDNRVSSAAKKIAKSLTPSWWAADGIHLTLNGCGVFDNEKAAASQLRELLKSKKLSAADKALAKAAALVAAGKPDEAINQYRIAWEKAQESLGRKVCGDDGQEDEDGHDGGHHDGGDN